MRIEQSQLNLGFYSTYIIFLAAESSEFSKSLEAQLLFILLSILLLAKKKFDWFHDAMGWKMMGLFTIVALLQYGITNVFMFGSVKFMIILLVLYYVIQCYKAQFTEVLMRTLYILTLITIPFYVVQLLDVNLLKSLLTPFNFSLKDQAEVGGIYAFFFNINPWGGGFRNSGFMWEPGAFGGMFTFLIGYEFIKSGQVLTKKIKFLLLYALTTLSTTTYLALLLLLLVFLLKYYKRRPMSLFFSVFLFCIFAYEVYSLPFIGDKIESYAENNVEYKNYYSSNDLNGRSIGRFAGLMIELDRLKSSPLLGSGWDTNYKSLGIGNEWNNPNGLAVLLGRFGIVGIILLLYLLYSFCSFLNKSGLESIILLLILLMPVFSNPFQLNLVFWTLVMTGLVLMTVKVRHPLNKKSLSIA